MLQTHLHQKPLVLLIHQRFLVVGLMPDAVAGVVVLAVQVLMLALVSALVSVLFQGRHHGVCYEVGVQMVFLLLRLLVLAFPFVLESLA
jgi:hypothetical protein